TFLGLTLGCARCHDHKFDPIPTADYYALAGVFKSTRTMADLAFVSNWLERPLPGAPTPEFKARLDKWEAELAAARAELERLKASMPAAEKAALDAAKARVAAAEKGKPVAPSAMAVEEGTPVDVPIHIRGSHLTLVA